MKNEHAGDGMDYDTNNAINELLARINDSGTSDLYDAYGWTKPLSGINKKVIGILDKP